MIDQLLAIFVNVDGCSLCRKFTFIVVHVRDEVSLLVELLADVCSVYLRENRLDDTLNLPLEGLDISSLVLVVLLLEVLRCLHTAYDLVIVLDLGLNVGNDAIFYTPSCQLIF